MSRIKGSIDYFNSLPEVIRLKELERYIDSNETINNAMENLKSVQRLMVLAKNDSNLELYKKYKAEYDVLYDEFLDIPFVEEYLELVSECNTLLEQFTTNVEYQLNKSVNGL